MDYVRWFLLVPLRSSRAVDLNALVLPLSQFIAYNGLKLYLSVLGIPFTRAQ